MSTVAHAVGRFVWHEQVSSAPKQAQDFYTQLFGWGTETFGASDYTMISSGGRAHGGFGTAMEGAPPPHWLNHIQVDDVDETADRLRLAAPVSRPDWGIRVAYVRDPSGNLVELYSAIPMEE